MTPQRPFVTRVTSLLLNRYTGLLAGLFCYSVLLKALGGLGGYAIVGEHLEILFVLYLYFYFNKILRPSRWQALLAAVPILLAYLGQDIYYLMYGKVFRVIESTELPELLAVLPTQAIALLIVGVVLPLAYFLYSIDYRKVPAIIAGALPVLFICSSAEIFPQAYATAFEKAGNEIVLWSDGASVENNGRLAMLLYREAERKLANLKTASYRDRPAYEQQARQLAAWVSSHSTRKNVHVVVMESFVDPTLFRGVRFTRDPAHPSFRKLFGNKLGFSVSPVFGGGTSQAEFEVLCGVPAFQELAGIEFNVFTGSQAYCLPGILGMAGYRTIATNAYKPSFFNTIPAYKGIGFGEMYFPREYAGSNASYFSAGDTGSEKYLFDAKLFDSNLGFVSNILKDKAAPPLFNYVLTIYGHMPHVIDEQKRPEVLKLIAKHYDAQLERSANQFYYRTQAIAAYVNSLIKLDRHSLIIMVSDHVPPLQFGPNSYRDFRYLDNKGDSIHMNRVLIIEDGEVRRYATIHHYDVPKLVLNYITDGAWCRTHVCGFEENEFIQDRMAMHEKYMRLMAHATEG